MSVILRALPNRLLVNLLTTETAQQVVTGRPYTSLDDLARRTRLLASAYEALATASALTGFGIDLREALWSAGALAQHALSGSRGRSLRTAGRKPLYDRNSTPRPDHSQTMPDKTTGTPSVPHAETQAPAAALASARARKMAETPGDARCALCADSYPARHLLAPTDCDALKVCPACVFEEELFAPVESAELAFGIDRLLVEDLSAPAAWTAVAALLACAGGEAFAARLGDVDASRPPSAGWVDPGQFWIWLPLHSRPAALAELGPGASLHAVVQAVERAHPDLRETYATRLAADLESGAPFGVASDDEYFVEEIWVSVIAYAVTFVTQRLERPGHRVPWRGVPECFEPGTLRDHLEEIGSRLSSNHLGVCFTLGLGFQVVAEALGWEVEH
ncbi:hypothetical protein ACFWP3_19155 [Streptomyces sp. NPDC058525]|uniref:hypothetical protein n=1 Tax=Streptomyces sp. NPDC058525 TaxID=3346538 RepID=UPI003662BF00